MRTLACLAVAVAIPVAACSSTAGTVTSPAAGSGAALDAAPAGAADADPDQITLYKAGRFVTRPRASATDHDGCIGTAIEVAACAQLAPAEKCDLAPRPDAGAVYCRGAAMGPGDMPKPRAAEPCACTCSPEYKTALGLVAARAQACARVP